MLFFIAVKILLIIGNLGLINANEIISDDDSFNQPKVKTFKNSLYRVARATKQQSFDLFSDKNLESESLIKENLRRRDLDPTSNDFESEIGSGDYLNDTTTQYDSPDVNTTFSTILNETNTVNDTLSTEEQSFDNSTTKCLIIFGTISIILLLIIIIFYVRNKIKKRRNVALETKTPNEVEEIINVEEAQELKEVTEEADDGSNDVSTKIYVPIDELGEKESDKMKVSHN